jgi:hypothetical protein
MSTGPYLPNSRRRWFSGKTRILLLGIFLFLMFLAVYQVLTEPVPPGQYGNEPHPSSGFDWVSSGSTALLLLCWLGWIFWTFRRARTFNAQNAEGLKLVSDADYGGAVEHYEGLLRRLRSSGNLRAVAEYNLGIALLRRGELDRALAQFTSVDQRSRLATIGLRPGIAAQLAFAHALRGDLETSERWLADYEVRKKGAADTRALDGLVVLVRSVAGIRRGRYDEVVRDLEARWRELENVLTGELLRPLRVLRAFALAQADGPRGAGAAETVLAGVRPSRRGEFAALGAAWPEMSAFLETNGL